MRTVSVVLSGGSIKGANLGAEIDSATYVVRLHDFHRLYDEKDHGIRYDYGVLPSPSLGRNLPEIEKLPELGWLLYRLSRQKRQSSDLTNIRGRQATSVLSKAEQKYFTKELAPTRGLMAIELAFEHLKADKVLLFGGDTLRTGVQTTFYSGEPNTIFDRHDMQFEKDLILDLWGANIIFY